MDTLNVISISINKFDESGHSDIYGTWRQVSATATLMPQWIYAPPSNWVEFILHLYINF